MKPNRCIAFSVAIAALLYLSTPAHGARRFHRTLSVAKAELRSLERMGDREGTEARFDSLIAYLERQIERHSDKPELAVELRLLLFRTYFERGDSDAAERTAKRLITQYQEAVGENLCKSWLFTKLYLYSNSRKTPWIDSLAVVVEQMGMKEAALTAVVTREDRDGDGVPDSEDRCRGFSDKRDSDDDGVPDGCDLCWGSPDGDDADGDHRPDGCDYCPGKKGYSDLDADFDDVSDGCDNCTGYYNPMVPRPEHDSHYDAECVCDDPPPSACCWQPDEDGDGLGDPCDNVRDLKLGSIVDSAGNVRATMEYNDFGKLSRWVKWDGENSKMMVTTYEYNQHRQLVQYVQVAQDGSSPPRTTKVFHDENGREIGVIKVGESEQGTFLYYDKFNEPIKRTTATDPPEKATVLELFHRDERGRLLSFEKLDPKTGRLEVIVTEEYIVNEDGSREFVTRKRWDEDSETMTIEGYGRGEDLPTWFKEYPNPISPRGSDPTEEPLVTRYFYKIENAANGERTSDWKTTVLPTGVREVHGWDIHGGRHTKGSRRVTEDYTTTVEEPLDSDKKNWTKTTEEFFPGGMYEVVYQRYPDGTEITYERDPDHPGRVLVEQTRRKSETGDQVTTGRFSYDEAGHIVRESFEDGDRSYELTSGFDFRGRKVRSGYTDALGTVTAHQKFNALDQVRFTYTVVHGSGFAMVLPEWEVDLNTHEDRDVVMRASSWRSRVTGPDSACVVASVYLVVRRPPIVRTTGSPADLESIADREFREFTQRRGLTLVAAPEASPVTLCGGAEARLLESPVATKLPGRGGHALQLITEDEEGGPWFVQLAVEVEHDDSDCAEVCASVRLLKEYLASFCPQPDELDIASVLTTVDTTAP